MEFITAVFLEDLQNYIYLHLWRIFKSNGRDPMIIFDEAGFNLTNRRGLNIIGQSNNEL